ncbi:hypothetical protein BDV96DRAFT_217467 [Lophiotrema nucula]|uniref:Uncharacterized protein n=1 Tax=Lophiotrema nucula TaxID=690887 RepID=A0A6A5ZPI3_9PLEO|nr:hypothetical protein BDV96DRAFT_217467 [Lophiotrema nucula]
MSDKRKLSFSETGTSSPPHKKLVVPDQQARTLSSPTMLATPGMEGSKILDTPLTIFSAHSESADHSIKPPELVKSQAPSKLPQLPPSTPFQAGFGQLAHALGPAPSQPQSFQGLPIHLSNYSGKIAWAPPQPWAEQTLKSKSNQQDMRAFLRACKHPQASNDTLASDQLFKLVRPLQLLNRQAEDAHQNALRKAKEDVNAKMAKEAGEKNDKQDTAEKTAAKKTDSEKKAFKLPKKRTENQNDEVKAALKQVRALARQDIETGADLVDPNTEISDPEPDSEEEMTPDEKRITVKKYLPLTLVMDKDTGRLPISAEGQRLTRIVLRNKQRLNQMRDDGKSRKDRKKAGKQPRVAWRRLRTEISKSLAVGEDEDKNAMAELMLNEVLGWAGDGDLSDLEDEPAAYSEAQVVEDE